MSGSLRLVAGSSVCLGLNNETDGILWPYCEQERASKRSRGAVGVAGNGKCTRRRGELVHPWPLARFILAPKLWNASQLASTV